MAPGPDALSVRGSGLEEVALQTLARLGRYDRGGRGTLTGLAAST
jgi:hypothetical protein